MILPSRPIPVLILASMTSCCGGAPAAQTPSSVNVIAVVKKGGPWTNVGQNASGAYEILPGGLPSGGFQLFFYAPYPSALRVSLDTTDLPQFENVPAGTDPAVSGYFRLNNINPNTNPSTWQITIRPPNAKLGSTAYSVNVVDVSVNPNFPPGNPNHESAPLVVKLVPERVFTLTVFKAGSGSGTVNSSPPGISCGVDCIMDFGQSMTVQLQPSPGLNSTFSGWSGACVGTGTCAVLLNGVAATVTATFDGSGGPQNCPGAAAIQGFTYVGKPGCATNDIAGHPTASLACDGQGYYCCEDANTNDTRCGGPNRRQFSPDCMAYDIRAQLKQPNGCYVSNTGP